MTATPPEQTTAGRGRGAAELHVRDPATGALLGSVERDRARGGRAASSAASRKVVPLWALLRVQDRGRYMRRMAQAVIDEFDELLEVIAREQGRPRAEIASLELLAGVDALIWMADEGARLLGGGRIGVSRSVVPLKRARIAYEPYGVIGVIGAGSAPFAQPLGQIAGALMAGNGVAFKPAARASLAGERIARLVARAGLPEGIVRILHGGADAGVALAQSPVEKILFTGSPPVGRVVARACVSREKEVALELGGKDAMLVLADAHLPRAIARGAVGGVRRGRRGARLDRAGLRGARGRTTASSPGSCGRPRRSRWATPRDPRVQVGPLASARAPSVWRSSSRRRSPRARGGTAAAPSSPPGGRAPGAFYAPGGDQRGAPEMRIMREPLDGPVLPVMAVDSIDQAIALANDSEFGLGASIWTSDRYRGARIARELRAGMVWLNDHLPGPMVARGPWGAAAGGGLGRTLGRAGLRACAQEKLITWDPPRLRGVWWGPYDEPARARRAGPGAGPLPPRGRARARLAPGRAAWRSRGSAPAPSGGGLPALTATPRWRRRRTAARSGRHVRAPRDSYPSGRCRPRLMQARSASASCAGASATRAACRGCSRSPSTSPA